MVSEEEEETAAVWRFQCHFIVNSGMLPPIDPVPFCLLNDALEVLVDADASSFDLDLRLMLGNFVVEDEELLMDPVALEVDEPVEI